MKNLNTHYAAVESQVRWGLRVGAERGPLFFANGNQFRRFVGRTQAEALVKCAAYEAQKQRGVVPCS